VRHEVATGFVAAQTGHVWNDLFAEVAQLDFRRARRAKQHYRAAAHGECDVHRQRIASDDDVAARDQSAEVTHRIVAARIDHGTLRAALQSIVALVFTRTAEQHELRVELGADAIDQIEIAVFTPRLERPAAAGAGVHTNDRAREVETEFDE